MKLKAILATLAIVVLVPIIGLAAAGSTTVAKSFNVTAGGVTSALTITNQPYCEILINAPAGSFQVTPQFSTDGSTYTTALNFPATIGQPGVYIAATDSGSDTNFRLSFARVSPTGISGQVICGDQANLPPVQTGQGIPVVKANGSPGPAMSCVVDSVTAAGASTAVTFTTAFATATASLSIIDRTDGTVIAAANETSVSNTGFTFVSVNLKVYDFVACGY